MSTYADRQYESLLWGSGTELTLRAGAEVQNMGSKGRWTSKRRQKIKTHGVVHTYGEVCWAGAGGYWNYVQPTDLEDFDDLSEDQQTAVLEAQIAKEKYA